MPALWSGRRLHMAASIRCPLRPGLWVWEAPAQGVHSQLSAKAPAVGLGGASTGRQDQLPAEARAVGLGGDCARPAQSAAHSGPGIGPVSFLVSDLRIYHNNSQKRPWALASEDQPAPPPANGEFSCRAVGKRKLLPNDPVFLEPHEEGPSAGNTTYIMECDICHDVVISGGKLVHNSNSDAEQGEVEKPSGTIRASSHRSHPLRVPSDRDRCWTPAVGASTALVPAAGVSGADSGSGYKRQLLVLIVPQEQGELGNP
ncbi:hypothetical protein QTO34_013726 [Cnephaeus nilssonii]|uniref:Uncharacterized protein n=1 Tax=Cnephaeus nilssonii TaxID=3371016 RepID=A0AA40I8K1_CNENI|nr:hypothetical protein QTO34_013726 [Eptesicus nilssonii]